MYWIYVLPTWAMGLAGSRSNSAGPLRLVKSRSLLRRMTRFGHRSHPQAHGAISARRAPMPLATVARWNAADRFTKHVATQGRFV